MLFDFIRPSIGIVGTFRFYFMRPSFAPMILIDCQP